MRLTEKLGRAFIAIICVGILLPMVVIGATLFWRLMFVVVFGVGHL